MVYEKTGIFLVVFECSPSPRYIFFWKARYSIKLCIYPSKKKHIR